MAGRGSFFDPAEFEGRGLSGASAGMWEAAESVRSQSMSINQGAQQLFGAYNNARAGVQPAGDAMAATSRHLERLNENLQRSPLLSGRPLAGGAVMSSGQIFGASYGAPVQVPGLRAGAETTGVAREMMAQSAMLAVERGGRSLLTDVLPSAAGLGAAFIPGVGPLAAPLVAAGTQALMPSVMRATGIDAMLAREEMTQGLQKTLGERLGAGQGVTERFRVGRERAQGLSRQVTDYISENQSKYTVGGIFNFGLNAEDYQPLVRASMTLNQTKDIRRLIEDGGSGMKEQLEVLTEVSAALGLTFEEVEGLAKQFGSTEGGTRAFGRFAHMIERTAGEAGGGLDRRKLSGFALGVRDQARLIGMQGDTAAQDVAGLTASIQRMANEELLGFDQLAAFGGATEQDRAQNMAASMFQLQSQMMMSGFGGLVRLNLMGGGAGGVGENIAGFGGRAGAAFAADPFGYFNARSDTRLNQRTGATAPFALMDQLRQIGSAFGDPRAGRAMFLQAGEQFGLTAPQAGAMYDFYGQSRRRFGKLAGGRMGGSQLMGLAMQFSQRTGLSIMQVEQKLESGDLTPEDLEQGELWIDPKGFGAPLSEEMKRLQLESAEWGARTEHTEDINRAEQSAQRKFDAVRRRSGYNSDAFVANLQVMGQGFWRAARTIFDTPDDKIELAQAEVRARQHRQELSVFMSPQIQGIIERNSSTFKSAGIDLNELTRFDPKKPDQRTKTAEDFVKGFRGEGVGLSSALTNVVRSQFRDDKALREVLQGDKSEMLLDVLNTKLGALSGGRADKLRSEFGEFFDADDMKVSEAEAKDHAGRLHSLLTKVNADTHGSLVTTLATTAVMQKAATLNAMRMERGLYSDKPMFVKEVGNGAKSN